LFMKRFFKWEGNSPGFQSQITISGMEDRMVQKNILANSLSFFRKQFIVIDPVRTRYRFHEEDLAFRERSSFY
ncbi:hypothetical protein DWY25_03335, partial [Holdemania filiformis]